jgi:hypothetical protein
MVAVLLDLIYRPHLIRYTDLCNLPQYAEETPTLVSKSDTWGS